VNLLCRNGNRILSTAANDAYICALDFAAYERSVDKERFEFFVLWGTVKTTKPCPGLVSTMSITRPVGNGTTLFSTAWR
jgi:hypothetical protein